MQRREFRLSAGAAALAALSPAAAGPGFASSRLSVVVRGSGPDVILIPGLTASRDMWEGMVAALPGYRYHLVQVAGVGGGHAEPEPQMGQVVGDAVQELEIDLSRAERSARHELPHQEAM